MDEPLSKNPQQIQADLLAGKQVGTASHTMALEAQETGEAYQKQRIKKRAKDIIKSNIKEIWD